MSKKIVIVGGGFAGFWAAMAARRIARSAADITLVSREPRLEIRPRLYEAKPETLAVDVRPYLDKVDVNFVRGEAAGLDTTAKIVSLDDSTCLPYDRLIVATGSRISRPPVPGAAEAYSVDTQADAITFDRCLKQLARDKRDPVVAVVGAGFTGIELSLELRDRFAVHGAKEAAERLRIVLIDRSDVVGPELGPGPRSEIERALQSARVELRLGATITTLEPGLVSFADGSALSADAVVLATGMRASAFAAKVPGGQDQLGRVLVDAELRALAAPDVFIAGDAAAADTGDGHRALQSCQHALQIGRVAGENAARDLLGMPLVPYSQLNYVTCLDLGRWGAVQTQGWDRRVELTGAEAKALKRKINTKLIYPPADGGADALLASSTIDIVKRYEIDGSR